MKNAPQITPERRRGGELSKDTPGKSIELI